MRDIPKALVIGALSLLAASARADVIIDWNQKLLPIVTGYSLTAPAYRDMAMVNLAVHQRNRAQIPAVQGSLRGRADDVEGGGGSCRCRSHRREAPS